MGLRGIGGVSLSKRQRLVEFGEGDRDRVNPWDAPGLSRSDRVIAFVEDLSVTSGALAFTKLRLRPWQRQFVRDVYATDRHGLRRVRTAVLSMGRKNGKTQLAASLALCHLCGPEAENRGEVYSAANDRFQASRIFDEMVAMVLAHPFLALRTNIGRFKKQIEDMVNGSIYVALSSEAKTKMGLSPSFVVYDELGQAASRSLYDAMDSALGARREPLLMVISTQAADDFAPMSQLIDYGERINRGDIDDKSFHLTFYAAPMDADPWDRKTWKLANPALDDFRSLEDVKRLALQAQRMPAQENSFRNLILNQRIAAEARFLEPALWKENGAPAIIPEGAKIYAGLDLSSTRDLSALVLVYEDGVGFYHVVPYCWLPGDPIARGDQDGASYAAWIRAGLLESIGEATDPRVIANRIAEINSRNPIITLAFDRWRIAEIKRELDAIGCNIPLFEHGQGYRDMSPAINVFHSLVVNKRLRHGNHPVLAMCAAHAVITSDPANNRKLDKSRSTGRIDALVALVMAISAATINAVKPIDVEAMIG